MAGLSVGGLLGDVMGGSVTQMPDLFGGAEQLGGTFGRFLLKRLRDDPAQSTSFKLGSQAIREALGAQALGARQRLGDRAVTGGFFDSGAVGVGLQDIDRAELQSFGSALRDLILGLEDRRTQDILPFLSGASGQNQAISNLSLATRGQNIDVFQDFVKMIATSGLG